MVVLDSIWSLKLHLFKWNFTSCSAFEIWLAYNKFLLRLLSGNLLVHLGINKKMKIFGGGGIIRQLLRLTTVSLQCDYYLVAYSSSILASPRCYDYLASSHSVDIIITGATSSSNSLWINMQSKKSIQKKGLAYKMLIHCESCVCCTLQDDAAQNV